MNKVEERRLLIQKTRRHEDSIKVAKWLDVFEDRVVGRDDKPMRFRFMWRSNGQDDDVFSTSLESRTAHDFLRSNAGMIAIIKKILNFAALHLEEIPRSEAVIMPFCDIAGKANYSAHGETLEEALISAVVVLIKESELHG